MIIAQMIMNISLMPKALIKHARFITFIQHFFHQKISNKLYLAHKTNSKKIGAYFVRLAKAPDCFDNLISISVLNKM